MRTVIRSLLLATLALPLSLHAAINGTPRQVVTDSCGISDWQTSACRVTLSGASLSANDLIVVMMSRNDDGFTALCPTEGGYTLAQNNGGGTANTVGGAICWKKASGSETTITGGIATGQAGQITAYVFSGTDLDLSSAASNQDNNNGAATTKSSSAASNTEATGLGVAMFATDDGIDNNVTGLTNSWVDLADSGSGSGVAESFAASKVLSSAASQETTATITSDQAWGTILVFNGAPAVSIDGTARQAQTDTCSVDEWGGANCRVTLSGGTLSANDLIVVAWSRNDDANTTPVLPAEGGYTLGDSYSNGYAGTLGCAWAWKKASGSETTVSPSWSSIVQGGVIAAAVFPGGGLNLAAPEAKAENETNVASASTSISSGTVSNVTANALGIATFCSDNGIANNISAYSNSWIEQAANEPGTGNAHAWIASKVVSSVASQETVATITQDEAYGAIAFFGGTGGALPETCASGRTPVLITDTSSASDTDNLLYGLGVTANQDTVCYPSTSVLGDTVNVTADGYPSFASAGKTATDSFTYTINDNGTGEGTPGKYETSFQPVIESVTGIATGQTTADLTVTPSGPTEGTVQGVAITQASYAAYGPPTHAQIRAGVDGNNANVAWGSEFTKSFLSTVSPGWTFSRASIQTYTNSSGNIAEVSSGNPAFNYSGGSAQGVLLEGSRTNLVLYSEQFDNAAWTKTDTTISANTTDTTDPAGANYAEKATEGTAGTATILQSPITVSSGATVAYSLYLKRGNNDWIRVGVFNGGSQFYRFVNTSTCALGSAGTFGTGVNVTAAIASVGNSWCRVSIVGYLPSLSTYGVLTASATANGNTTRANNTTYYIWGAQLEAGAFATSYIPTTTAPVTRAATSLSRSWNTQTNVFSGYIIARPAVASTYTATAQPLMTLYKDANNYLTIVKPTTAGRMDMNLAIGGTTATAQVTGLTWAERDKLDIRFRKNASGIKLWVEGSAVETTTGIAPNAFTTPPDSIKLGVDQAGASGDWIIENTQFWNSVDDTALGALNP